MRKAIYFDMDGTIADFYNVDNWLDYLEKENSYPYQVAKPLVNFSVLARYIHKAQKNGWIVGIISWTSKKGTAEFNQQVKAAKKKWLKKHLPSVLFDEMYIIDYGTPKNSCGQGILFDDEERNRETWGAEAYDVNNILTDLKNILEG